MPEHSPGARRYVLSRYVHTLRLDDDSFAIGNGLTFQRMIASESLHQVLQLFADEPMSLDELIENVELPSETPRETLTAMFRTFVDKGFLVPVDDFDEDAQLRKLINAKVISDGRHARWQIPYRVDLDTFDVPPAMAGSLRHLEILFLGGCMVELVEEPLRALAPSYGLTLGVRAGWLDDLHLLEAPTDLVVLQPGVYRVLAPLFGRAFFASEQSRRELIAGMKQVLTQIVTPLLAFRGHVLVQGISALQLPPHGRADARLPTNHDVVMRELNDHLRALVADRPNMMFVDEERLVSNHGKAHLLDDMITSAAHHGAVGARLPQLLAREYLDCYVILSGLRRIKCIITDLDNTLWSGVVGEGDGPDPLAHPFLVIRETLATLAERGILLASCSKNNEADVMAFWKRLEGDPVGVTADRFVVQRINWEPKSRNVATILEQLGVAPEAALFLDDNPIERAEVQARFPGLRVLGEDLKAVRAQLLTDPCLQPNVISDEARQRTVTTRATLAREAARATTTDPKEFLRSLAIEMRITRVASRQHVERLVELSQRTNQFNTTLVRYDAPALEELAAASDASAWALAVRDRFAPYGVVGICVVRGDAIENVCISCRTIGLAVEQPFLAAVLGQSGLHARRALGRIIIGERNQPSRRLFSDAGFVDLGDGVYAREPTAQPPAIDASVYRVTISSEAELTAFAGTQS